MDLLNARMLGNLTEDTAVASTNNEDLYRSTNITIKITFNTMPIKEDQKIKYKGRKTDKMVRKVAQAKRNLARFKINKTSGVACLLGVRVSKERQMGHHLLVGTLILFSDLNGIIQHKSHSVGLGFEDQNILTRAEATLDSRGGKHPGGWRSIISRRGNKICCYRSKGT